MVLLLKNTVTINGGTVGVADSTESSDTVFGGYSASGEAVSNILTVSGGDLIGHVTSGYGKTGASDNTLTMTGGSSTKTVAGYAETGDAVNNTLVFSGGTSAITMAAQSGGQRHGEYDHHYRRKSGDSHWRCRGDGRIGKYGHHLRRYSF